VSVPVLDILISELSKILGITPEEVKTRFTQEELKELLNSSLCEPDSVVGPPLPNISSLSCDELQIPDLLPPEATDILDELEKTPIQDNQKCVKAVEEINPIIEQQNIEYNKHKLLIEKLIEYRDHYSAIAIYFEERSKEASKFLGEFKPILEEIKKLEAQKVEFTKKRDTTNIYEEKNLYQRKISETLTSIRQQQDLLNSKEKSFPIFDDYYVDRIRSYTSNSIDPDPNISSYIRDAFNNYIDYSDISKVSQLFKRYSEFIICGASLSSPNSIQDVIQQSYFKFNLGFLKLSSFTFDQNVTDKSTGESHTNTIPFPIKGNPLLQKDSFFKTNSIFSLREQRLNENEKPEGTIYERYYNLFEKPIDNFFTINERGLTSEASLVDPQLKGTGAETKRENSGTYFVQDLEKLQDFYNNFEKRFEIRKEEVREKVISPAKEGLRIVLSSIARKEVQLILALSGVSKKLPQDSTVLDTNVNLLNQQNLDFVKGLSDLDEEIVRLKLKMEEIKPTPENVKKLLKEKSPECFDKIDSQIKDCGDTKLKLGSDPFFTKTIEGIDPTLPTQNQLCYWIEFSKIINKTGLLPVPNLKGPPQLRYWPIGFIIPYPGGLIKIPLPIVWLPLITISSPVGNIVVFLTINGVYISPVVFFVSSTGFKQHILTLKGSSNKFGYAAEDALIKAGLRLPLGVLAAKEKTDDLVKKAKDGPLYKYGESEQQKILTQQSILTESLKIAASSGNINKVLQSTREIKNFQEAFFGDGPFSLLSKMMDRPDSVKDAIDDAKKALYQRLEEIGNAPMTNVNKLKKKIIDRQNSILSDLTISLERGDLDRAKIIRESAKSDGIEVSQKIDAIKDDLKEFYDKIKFPKIIIPKDTSTLDPKLNGLFELIKKVYEYTNIYGTQFFSKDNQKLKNQVLINIAKYEKKLKEITDDAGDDLGKIDVEKDLKKVKSTLSKINSTIIRAISGNLDLPDPKSAKQKSEELEVQLKNETDPVKRKKLQKKIEKANSLFSESFENDLIKKFISLTPATIASLESYKIEFDPFSACCAKKPFSIELDSTSPAFLSISAVDQIMKSYINSLTAADLKSLLGGATIISSSDLISLFIGIAKNKIPNSATLPVPPLTVIATLKMMSGILISLIEPKAPNVAAQPQLPAAIVIDLNLLKAPLLELLIAFLLDFLPDPNSSSFANTKNSTSSDNLNQDSTLSQNQQATLSKDLVVIGCLPEEQDQSTINLSFSNQLNLRTSQDSLINSNASQIATNSKKFMLPAFQTLNIDLLSINSNDIITIIKNFIDLKLNTISSLIDPFYIPLKAVKGTNGVNLNILEDAQYKIPPYGPPTYAAFVAYTKFMQLLPKSANFGIINTQLAKSLLEKIEPALRPVGATAPIIAAVAGAADSILPSIRVPQIDYENQTIVVKDTQLSTLALRQLNPFVNQDDLPPWERLSSKNILFAIFVDQFIASAADKLGFFRSFV
jgi:hypothetical protein